MTQGKSLFYSFFQFIDLFCFSIPPWEENAPKFECIMKMDDDAKENLKNKINVVNEKDKKLKNKTGNIYSIETPLMDLIKMDSRNEKLWDELIAKKVTKFEWYQEVEEVIFFLKIFIISSIVFKLYF